MAMPHRLSSVSGLLLLLALFFANLNKVDAFWPFSTLSSEDTCHESAVTLGHEDLITGSSVINFPASLE